MIFPNPTQVLAHDYVQSPVQVVFNGPMGPYSGRKLFGVGGSNADATIDGVKVSGRLNNWLAQKSAFLDATKNYATIGDLWSHWGVTSGVTDAATFKAGLNQELGLTPTSLGLDTWSQKDPTPVGPMLVPTHSPINPSLEHGLDPKVAKGDSCSLTHSFAQHAGRPDQGRSRKLWSFLVGILRGETP